MFHDGEDVVVDDKVENLHWANYWRVYTLRGSHYKGYVVVVHNVDVDVQNNLGDSDGENRGELNDEALNFHSLLHYGEDGCVGDVDVNDARYFFH